MENQTQFKKTNAPWINLQNGLETSFSKVVVVWNFNIRRQENCLQYILRVTLSIPWSGLSKFYKQVFILKFVSFFRKSVRNNVTVIFWTYTKTHIVHNKPPKTYYWAKDPRFLLIFLSATTTTTQLYVISKYIFLIQQFTISLS